MVGRAITERWDISPERRKLVVNRLFEILESTDDEKVKVSAIRCISGLDKINVTHSAAVEALSIEQLKNELRARLIAMKMQQDGVNVGAEPQRITDAEAES